MAKRIISLLVVVSILLSIGLVTIAAELKPGDKRICNMTAFTQKEFRIVDYKGQIDISGGHITLSYNERGYIDFSTLKPIIIEKKNLTFRVKAKIEFDSSAGQINYMMLRFYGSAASEAYVKSSPVSGEWYETEIRLDQAKLSSNSKEYEVGDTLNYIRFDVQNKQNIPFKLYVEYLEIIEPEIDDSWASYKKPETIGGDVISSINSKLAVALPGETIVVPNGKYTNAEIRIPEKCKGEEGKPITLKAETPGKVILSGYSFIEILGSYTVVDGFMFTDGMNIKGAVQMRGDHNRLTNTAIISYNGARNPKTSHQWVTVGGQYHHIDHNFLYDKTGVGVMFEVYRRDDPQPEGHVIEYNYFGKYPKSGQNGTETIRYGLSGVCHSGMGESVFRYNFFEECNGEDEIISIKSMGSTYSYNTIYASTGAITLRHGGYNTINGNLFIGDDSGGNSTRGIRVIGPEQKVYDNYFLNGSNRARTTTLECGVKSDAGDNYEPIINLEFHNNTYLGCDNSLSIGLGYGGNAQQGKRIEVPQGKINDNIFYSTLGALPMFKQSSPTHNLEFANNVFYGEKSEMLTENAGLTVEKPTFKFTEDGYVYLEDGRGANIDEVRKAPTNPMQNAPDYVKEMYEKGELIFKPMSHDVFNRKAEYPTDSVDDIIVLALDKPYAYDKGVKVQVDSNDASIAPMIIDGRTMVPLRFISESCGATVKWDEATQGITIENSVGYWENDAVILAGRTIKLTVGGTELSVLIKNKYSPFNTYQDEVKTLDVPATVINGRTFIPLRACGEALGLQVCWDDRGVIVMFPSEVLTEEMVPGSEKMERYVKIMGK